MIVYERQNGNFWSGNAPTGTFGQMSMRRLCETLEACGELRPGEKITHLEIAGNLIRYRVERPTVDEPQRDQPLAGNEWMLDGQ